MPNQYNPVVPLADIEYWIAFYWFQKKPDTEIWATIKHYHIDTTRYGLGFSSYRKYREQLGLLGTRQEGLTVNEIMQHMAQLCIKYPNAGREEMGSIFFQRFKKRVARSVITMYFKIYEPDLLAARKVGRLKRKQFYCAGVNNLWCFDQHDKWKYKFGLCLHICVEPFSGYILWLRIWWNNSNPRLIVMYYLDVVQALGYIPLLTQSGPGTENTCIALAQTYLCQWYNYKLPADSIQHKWKCKSTNIKPKIKWSQLRNWWLLGFKNHIQDGLDKDVYDPLDLLQVLIFQWIFIPWLQGELSFHRDRLNNKLKRRMKNKLTPHGRPVDIFYCTKQFNSSNFAVAVKQKVVNNVRKRFVPKGHPLLKLVPDSFDAVICPAWYQLGCPPLNCDNSWPLFTALFNHVANLRNQGAFDAATLDEWNNAQNPETWRDIDAQGDQDEEETEAVKGMLQSKGNDGMESDVDPFRLEAFISDDEGNDKEDAWYGPPHVLAE